jgi:hypothetical protein
VAHTPTRSTQFLAGLSTLLLAITVLFGLFLVVGAIGGFGPNGDEVAVHSRVDVERLADLPADTVRPDTVDVTIRVRDASREQLWWAAARDLAPGVVMIVGLWLLRGLLRSVRDRDPFTVVNVKRLRTLALVVLIGVPVAGFVSSLFASELASSADLQNAGVQLSVPGTALLGGLALLVLSEVFASGVRLRDDLEGTV